MSRADILRTSISLGAARIAKTYRAVRHGDGRKGALMAKICVAPDGSGTWHAWTSTAWPSDGTSYDMRGTIERQTPRERSDALAAELTELERDIYRKPADRIYARSKWYSNDEAERAIRLIREALNADGGAQEGGGQSS